jgi:hypothetical protein
MLYIQTHLYKMMVINMSVIWKLRRLYYYYLLFIIQENREISRILIDYSFLFTCNVGMKLKIYTFLQRNLYFVLYCYFIIQIKLA